MGFKVKIDGMESKFKFLGGILVKSRNFKRICSALAAVALTFTTFGSYSGVIGDVEVQTVSAASSRVEIGRAHV